MESISLKDLKSFVKTKRVAKKYMCNYLDLQCKMRNLYYHIKDFTLDGKATAYVHLHKEEGSYHNSERINISYSTLLKFKKPGFNVESRNYEEKKSKGK